MLPNKDMAKPPMVILSGPTAVGKTKLSIALAKAIGGEIISADSCQVYRHMDIGSAKITEAEMQGVPHHMIDILEPWEEFSVAVFKEKCQQCLPGIYARGHIPIVTGGTGFYVQALLRDIDFGSGGESAQGSVAVEADISTRTVSNGIPGEKTNAVLQTTPAESMRTTSGEPLVENVGTVSGETLVENVRTVSGETSTENERIISGDAPAENAGAVLGGALAENAGMVSGSFAENGEYRARLEELADREGSAHLHQMLQEIDPASAEAIHPNNRKRVIRALEFFHLTGEPISRHNEREREKEAAYNAVYFVLNDRRERIYENIGKRVDEMLRQGLVAEVERLREMGCHRGMVSMQALGYKEILAYLEGETSLKEAVETIKRDTRHFAKRQLTWFRREKDVIWVDKEKFDYDEDRILKFMLEELCTKGIGAFAQEQTLHE